MERSAAFYALHFGYTVVQNPDDRITELVSNGPGTRLMLHKAGKAQKLGQSSIKLVFNVEDVSAFCREAAKNDLHFGSIHNAGHYCFANAKDPDQNALQVTSRPK